MIVFSLLEKRLCFPCFRTEFVNLHPAGHLHRVFFFHLGVSGRGLNPSTVIDQLLHKLIHLRLAEANKRTKLASLICCPAPRISPPSFRVASENSPVLRSAVYK